jgi:hypothetical protein
MSEQQDMTDELKDEYAFDYNKARPNRFAQKREEGSMVVVLEPDIAQVFTTPEAVKKVLRALIETMPVSGDQKL